MEELLQGLVALLLGGALVALRSFVAAKLTPQRLDGLLASARTVVQAVERTPGASGEEKYDLAAQAFSKLAGRFGYHRLSGEEVRTFIEAAVSELRALQEGPALPDYNPYEADTLPFPTETEEGDG